MKDNERDDENKPKFRVTDRRIFTPNGELKQQKPQEESEPHKVPLRERIFGKKKKQSDDKSTQPVQNSLLQEINFSTFIMSLGSSALLQMGEIPDPQTQKKEKDLQLAKQTIDIISMLREKTKGNLDREEERLIEGLLYELKMRYVKASQG